jgi:hypothetical protein
MEEETHGIFAMRAPARPNPIGISVVRLVGIQDNILHIEDVDIVDGTPLLDIKPYVTDFDWREAERIGWLPTKPQHAKKHKSTIDSKWNNDIRVSQKIEQDAQQAVALPDRVGQLQAAQSQKRVLPS